MKTSLLAAALSLAVVLATLHADTPERLDDPDALRQLIPRLREQVDWRTLATPEQIRLYEGPETVWPEVAASAYDLTGFDTSILGGKLPPPGAHPRILFNQEDIPAIRKRLLSTPDGHRQFALTSHIFKSTMLDPNRPDGQIFAKLASGQFDGLTFGDAYKGANGNHMFEGFPAEVYPSHVCYWPRNLAALAFYALLENDTGLSQRVASAVANYYRLREPLIDFQNDRARNPADENSWPADLWRGMHWVAGEAHLGIAYDLTARFMSDEQKALMRRVISKATAGKRSYGANGPLRWRDNNWVGWDTQHFITHLAIEGEEGFDPGVYAAVRDTVRAYLTWGISEHGTIFETNGKNGAGIHFALTSAIALARRGDNFLGHPHLRKMSASQVHQVVPAGGLNVNNGTYGCAPFGNAGFLKNLYPGDLAADWLIPHGRSLPDDTGEFDPTAYQEQLNTGKINWKRRHPLTADGYFDFAAYTGAKDASGKPKAPWEREHLGLPTDFADPVHGQLSTRSSDDKDALFLFIEARADLYSGGHQHHDAGHFYLAADGVNWGVESGHGARDSAVHSVVTIDGKGQGDTQHCAPAKAEWIGSLINEHGAFARVNLKHAYDYIWTTPMHYSWTHPESQQFRWEPETDPFVVSAFKGTQHWKGRIWMPSYWHNNWGPTMRAAYNPVEYAFRTAGIVRGKYPYAVVIDDIKKDDVARRYEWQMQVPAEARLIENAGGRILLGIGDQRSPGEPLLWIQPFPTGASPIAAKLEPVESEKVKGQRLVLAGPASTDARFRVLLIPSRSGDPFPECGMDPQGGSVNLSWNGQADTLSFEGDQQTRLVVRRGNTEILNVR